MDVILVGTWLDYLCVPVWLLFNKFVLEHRTEAGCFLLGVLLKALPVCQGHMAAQLSTVEFAECKK